MSEPNLISPLPQTIDPLAPGPHGRYDDHLVSVLRTEPPRGRAAPLVGAAANGGLVVRTDHFCLSERGRRIEVTHWLSPDQLDNDVAGLLAEELFAPGWVSGLEIFERIFTGVVRSCVDDPLLAWSTFYGNTLAGIRQCWRAPGAAGREDTTIGELAPVYAHALQLIPAGQVLDLGSCFGFLPLLLAERPDNTVTASDLSGGSMGLLSAVAAARGQQVNTLVCDAARIPVPDGWADTVSVIHLLEHVSLDHGRAVIGEALRVARRQVVVAVPVEDEPTAVYGHLRTFDLRQLGELGDLAGQHGRVHEHHGGWLVLTAG
jgi:methyltransferase family protein